MDATETGYAGRKIIPMNAIQKERATIRLAGAREVLAAAIERQERAELLSAVQNYIEFLELQAK